MREKILNDITEAMRSKDKVTLSTLRMVKGSIQLEEINKKRELNDEEVISIISKQVKTRKESIVEFDKGNRIDLVDAAVAEIEILEKYLPKQLSEEEVKVIVDEEIDKLGITSIKDMGKAMGVLSSKLKGKTDLSIVSKLIKEKLN